MGKYFRPMLEVLEALELLSGLPFASIPVIETMDQEIHTILPGAQHQVLGRYQISTTGRSPALLIDMSLIPVGDALLAQNVGGVDLWVDSNCIPGDGPRGDGYETWAGSSLINRDTDVVSIPLYRPVWAKAIPLKMELLANFHQCLSGTNLGLYIAEANFTTLHGDHVAPEQVLYRGVEPVLQLLETRVTQFYQLPMENFLTTIRPGQKNAELLRFVGWANTQVSASVAFTAAQGNLRDIENPRLVHTNVLGQQDVSMPGTLTGTKLTFTFPMPAYQNGFWSVMADIKSADQLGDDTHFQLKFAPDSNRYPVIDLESGQRQVGFIFNGIGVGQVQLWAETTRATAYRFEITSFPTITDMPPPLGQGALLSAGGTVTLYEVKVAADPIGPIAIKQLIFSVSAIGGTLGNFQFFRGNIDITNSVQILYGNDLAVVTFNQEERISAGSSYDYTLKAKASGFHASSTISGSVSSELLDVLWSDLSAEIHDEFSSDWFNGHGLLSFPLNQHGIIAQ